MPTLDAEIQITKEMAEAKKRAFAVPGFHLVTVPSLEQARAAAKGFAASQQVPSFILVIPGGHYQVTDALGNAHHDAVVVDVCPPGMDGAAQQAA